MFKIGQITDIGLVRKQNEDSLIVVENKLGDKLLLVADGMGGHNAGDVASAMAVKIISEQFQSIQKQVIYTEFIRKVITLANQKIYKQSLLDVNLSKMGTTVSLLIITKDAFYTGHIGDSRIYFDNKKYIQQISKDHTLVQAMMDSGTLSPHEAEQSKYRNVLLQALGTSKKLSVEIKTISMAKNCRFLLCSDGLTGPVSDSQIHSILNEEISLEDKLQKLVELANSIDGSDNVSIIIVESGV